MPRRLGLYIAYSASQDPLALPRPVGRRLSCAVLGLNACAQSRAKIH